MSMTSVPRDVMPSLSAAASDGDERRQSLPIATASTPDHSANAAPIERAEILVELVGDDAADVVRLEEASEISMRRHGHRIVLNPVGVRSRAAGPSR